MRIAVPTILLAAVLAAHPAFAQELTGAVREATPRFVQLGALSGRDFFDAVVALDSIEAVIVRTKD